MRASIVDDIINKKHVCQPTLTVRRAHVWSTIHVTGKDTYYQSNDVKSQHLVWIEMLYFLKHRKVCTSKPAQVNNKCLQSKTVLLIIIHNDKDRSFHLVSLMLIYVCIIIVEHLNFWFYSYMTTTVCNCERHKYSLYKTQGTWRNTTNKCKKVSLNKNTFNQH